MTKPSGDVSSLAFYLPVSLHLDPLSDSRHFNPPEQCHYIYIRMYIYYNALHNE